MDQNLKTYASSLTALKYRFRKQLSKVEERVFNEWMINPDLRICDLGVGAGRTTTFFKSHPNYVGIDYAPQMIEICRQRFPDESDDRFVIADARNLPFKEAEFDRVIFSFNGIDYITPSDREKALHEVRRVLKTDGTFFFSTHNIRALTRVENFRRNALRWISDRWRMLLLRSLNPKEEIHSSTTKDRALVRDMLTLTTHYISFEEQVRELARVGLVPIVAYDECGRMVGPDESPHGKWFYLLCGKIPA